MFSQKLVDFETNPTTKNWHVVDDVVMGGRSTGTFEISKEGYGKFHGEVSLENNGGFSSVRCDIETVPVTPKSTIRIRLKGDGKAYQFRVKARKSDYYSYTIPFTTSGEWETLEFPLKDLYPKFRGRQLDLPNFDQETIEELRFLIGNKKVEGFGLVIEYVRLTRTN